MLLTGGDGPIADLMKQYEEAGVSRLVVGASAVSEDGVKVVRGLGSIVERAAKLYKNSEGRGIDAAPFFIVL